MHVVILALGIVFASVSTALAGNATLVREIREGTTTICIYDDNGKRFSITLPGLRLCPLHVPH